MTQAVSENGRDAKRLAAKHALQLDEVLLLRECELSFFIASGPGGQHRNKTESGVRLVHVPTGVVVTATERRSQHQNRGVALERLRMALAKLCVVQRKRHATRPTRGSKERRLTGKRHAGVKKQQRSRLARDE